MRRVGVIALISLCGVAAADDTIAIARKQMRDADEVVADEGVRILVNVGSPDAVRALHDELNAAFSRLGRQRRAREQASRKLEPLFNRLIIPPEVAHDHRAAQRYRTRQVSAIPAARLVLYARSCQENAPQATRQRLEAFFSKGDDERAAVGS